MPARTSYEKGVCLSVKRVICDKTKETCASIIIPHERSFTLVLWQELLVGANPFSWSFGSKGPCWSENADFQPIFARSASAVTPSKKVQLTLTGSPLRAFQWCRQWVMCVSLLQAWRPPSSLMTLASPVRRFILTNTSSLAIAETALQGGSVLAKSGRR